MSDKSMIEKAVARYKAGMEEHHRKAKEAAEKVKQIRQVKTELPNR